jgi:outer membrane biosynthesis protein TonB
MIAPSFLLLIVGVFTAVFVFGGPRRRWSILPIVGVLAVGVLSAAGLSASIIYSAFQGHVGVQVPSATQVVEQVNGVTHTVVQSAPNFTSYNGGNRSIFVSGPNWSRILVVVILIAFLAAMVVRKGMSPVVGHGVRRVWRFVAAIILIAVFFLGTMRTSYTISQTPSPVAQVATQNGIQAEMDQFDAPRIPVSPDIPKAPSFSTPTAQPPVVIKTSKGKSTKATAASTNKRKKSDKPPAADDAKQAESVAQSNSAGKATATKENVTSDDKQALVAEAESDNSKTRPAWVDEPPKLTGNTRREVIAIGPYATVDECKQSIDVYLRLKAYERIQELAGRPYAEGPLPSLTFRNGAIFADGKLMSYGRGNSNWGEPDPRLQQLSDMGIGADYLRREIVAKESKSNKTREFIDTVESTVGPMKMLYLQIEFTPAIDRDLLRHWDTHERRERFAIVGAGASSILGFIGLVFGLLKVDTWTKGYYSKRLFIGVPAAIIAGLLLMSLFVGKSMRSESGPTVPLPQGYSN